MEGCVGRHQLESGQYFHITQMQPLLCGHSPRLSVCRDVELLAQDRAMLDSPLGGLHARSAPGPQEDPRASFAEGAEPQTRSRAARARKRGGSHLTRFCPAPAGCCRTPKSWKSSPNLANAGPDLTQPFAENGPKSAATAHSWPKPAQPRPKQPEVGQHVYQNGSTLGQHRPKPASPAQTWPKAAPDRPKQSEFGRRRPGFGRHQPRSWSGEFDQNQPMGGGKGVRRC